MYRGEEGEDSCGSSSVDSEPQRQSRALNSPWIAGTKRKKNFARKKRVTNPFTMGLLCVVLQTQVYYARSIAATKSFNAPAARVQQHITVLGNWVTLEPHNHSATGHSPNKPPQAAKAAENSSKTPFKRRDMTRLGGTRNEGEWPSGLRQGQ